MFGRGGPAAESATGLAARERPGCRRALFFDVLVYFSGLGRGADSASSGKGFRGVIGASETDPGVGCLAADCTRT